jgi:hypothetical protein
MRSCYNDILASTSDPRWVFIPINPKTKRPSKKNKVFHDLVDGRYDKDVEVHAALKIQDALKKRRQGEVDAWHSKYPVAPQEPQEPQEPPEPPPKKCKIEYIEV